MSIVLMAVSASAQEPEQPVTEGLKLIAEKDWTKETEYNGWMIFNDDGMIFPEIVDEGLALTNPEGKRRYGRHKSMSWMTSHWNRIMTISSACF